MCGLRIDWDLPVKLLCLSALFIAVSFIPAALWAGAITPVLTTTNLSLETQIPVFAPDPSGRYWNDSWAPFPMPVNYTDQGSFSYSPAVTDSGLILKNAAAAISANNSVVKHSRNDLTQYFYNGRSYGIGASPGLISLEHANMTSYTYNETGYKTTVTCARNMSTLWGWEIVEDNTGLAYPDIWFAKGRFPDNQTDYYAQVGWTTDDMVSITARINNQTGIVMIAGGKHYSQLNYTQCNVAFTPTKFLVGVDVSQRTVNVTIDANATNVADIDPTADNGPYKEQGCGEDFLCGPHMSVGHRGLGLIASQVLHGVKSLTRINTSIWTSVVGDTLRANIQNAKAAKDHGLLDSNMSDDDVDLHAIATSLESMIDDILVALSSSQIIVAKSTKPVPATARVGAVRLGEASSIYIITALNMVLILILIVELYRTSIWRNLLLFDYRDIKSVAIAVSAKGAALAEAVYSEHGKSQSTWLADPADRRAGRIKVRLGRSGEGVAIAPDGATEEVQLLPRRRVTGRGPWTYEQL